MAFSASDAAFEGFRLARRSPLTILIWALFYGLMTVVMFAIAGGAMGNFMELAQGMETGGEPSEAEVMAFMSAYFGFLGLILPVSLILGSVAYAAVNRAIVRPAESAFGYLRLGMDEVRVLVVQIALGLIFGLGFGLLGGAVFGLLGAAMGMAGESMAPLLGLLMFVAIIAVACAAVWVTVRLSLALPITVAERRIAIFESWNLTRGHFWSLLGMALLAFVMCIVVQILLSIVLMPVLYFAGGGLENLSALETMTPVEIMTAMAPVAIAILVFSAIVSALQAAIIYTPFASAYLGLSGRGEGAAPDSTSSEI
jgi:hypothetical protein